MIDKPCGYNISILILSDMPALLILTRYAAPCFVLNASTVYAQDNLVGQVKHNAMQMLTVEPREVVSQF